MLQQPTTLLETFVDFAGTASGFATSPRNLAIGVVALLLGVFRLSSAWALIWGCLAGISQVHMLSAMGRYSGLSPERELYHQNATLIAAVLVSALWYVVGRTVRTLKAPMLSTSDADVIKASGQGSDEGSPLEGGDLQCAKPDSSIDATRTNRMVQPLLTALVGGAFLFILIGFGIQVYRLPPPETPVLFGYVKQPGEGLVWRYATIDCVKQGASLEGYVWDREEMMDPISIFDLQPDVSVGTLGNVRALARTNRHSRDADPICSQSGGFDGEATSLLFSLINWHSN